MRVRRIEGRKNERGIAIIVVVGIMVALIMVTTALLGLVNRTTATAKALFQRDLARIAALSGKVQAVARIDKNTSIADIFDKDASDTAGKNIFQTAAFDITYFNAMGGLLPLTKVTIPTREYSSKTALVPPMADIYGDPTLMDNKVNALGSDTFGALGLTYTSTFSTAIEPYMPVCTKVSGGFNIKTKTFMVCGFDKDMQPVPYPSGVVAPATTPDDTWKNNSFYASMYSIYIQDLSGCAPIKLGATYSGMNFAGYVLSAIAGSPLTAGTVNTAAGKTFYSYADLRNELGDDTDAWGRWISQITFLPVNPAAADVPAINLDAASEGLVHAVGTALDNVAHPLRAKLSALDGNWNAAAQNAVLTNAKTVIAGFPATNNDVEAMKTAFKSPYDNAWFAALADDATRAKAANDINLIKYSLFGDPPSLYTDGTWSATVPATEADADTALGGCKTLTYRLVNSGTTGQYFRIFVRGALYNLAKAEQVSESNLEILYDKTAKKIVYQRWFENE